MDHQCEVDSVDEEATFQVFIISFAYYVDFEPDMRHVILTAAIEVYAKKNLH